MALIGTLTSGVSAMRAFTKNLEVIGNNIANVNTVGFKGSAVTFADTFSNTLRNAAPSSGSSSNVGPIQIGTGTSIADVSTQFTQGALSNTGVATDLGISGKGFFLVKDPNTGSTFATRAGNFRFDDRGYLVTYQGYRVQGLTGGNGDTVAATYGDIKFGTPPDPTPSVMTGAKGLGVGTTLTTAVTASSPGMGVTAGTFNVNGKTVTVASGDTLQVVLGKIATATNNRVTASYDSDAHTIKLSSDDPITLSAGSGNFLAKAGLVENSTGEIEGSGINPISGTSGTLASVFGSALTAPAVDGSGNGSLTINGVSVAYNTSQSIATVLSNINASAAGVTATYDATADKIVLTNIATGDTNVTVSEGAGGFADATGLGTSAKIELGFANPQLKSYSIGPDGSVVEFYTNGESATTNRLLLRDFKDPTALTKTGDNLYTGFDNAGLIGGVTPNAEQNGPAGNGLGAIQSGVLEQSNVDLTQQFSDMITVQRSFQASSRLITISDQVLEDIVNLKR